MHVSLHRSLSGAVFGLQQGTERGEGASKRVISVPCRERAGDRVTDMQNDRNRELRQRCRGEKESFPTCVKLLTGSSARFWCKKTAQAYSYFKPVTHSTDSAHRNTPSSRRITSPLLLPPRTPSSSFKGPVGKKATTACQNMADGRHFPLTN